MNSSINVQKPFYKTDTKIIKNQEIYSQQKINAALTSISVGKNSCLKMYETRKIKASASSGLFISIQLTF